MGTCLGHYGKCEKQPKNAIRKDEVHCNLIFFSQDLRVLIHKYKLLLSKGRLKEYVIAGCEMLAFYFRDVYNKPEVKGIAMPTYPVATHWNVRLRTCMCASKLQLVCTRML